MKRFLFLTIFLPFAAAAQTSGDVHFYLDLVAPPALDAGDSITIRNGVYVGETGALAEQAPIELQPQYFDAQGLKTRAGDDHSGGRPVILLQIDSVNYRADSVGLEREFEGRKCREVVVKIPFRHNSGATLQAHIFCPAPTPHDPNSFTHANRYVGAGETHYELVAVRIFRKHGAPPLTAGNENDTANSESPPKSGADSNSSAAQNNSTAQDNSAAQNNSSGGASYYARIYQLKRDVARLGSISNPRERSAAANELQAKAQELAEKGVPEQELAEIKKQIDEAENPKYELGEDVWVEIVPPRPMSGTDSVELDINYVLSQITTAQIKSADYKMAPVSLQPDYHKVRNGDDWSGGKPVIMLDLEPQDYRQALGRELIVDGRKCRETVIEVPFFHTSAKLIPAHIICPRPGYEHNASVQHLEHMKPDDTDRVFIAMRIFEKRNWAREAQEAFTGTRTIIPRYMTQSQLLARDACMVLQAYGLISITATGKYSTWGGNGQTQPANQYYRIEQTALAAQYLYPESKWAETMITGEMARVYSPWVAGERPSYGSEQFRNEMNARADMHERLGRYFKDGELWNAAVFDDRALLQGIESGVLKAK